MNVVHNNLPWQEREMGQRTETTFPFPFLSSVIKTFKHWRKKYRPLVAWPSLSSCLPSLYICTFRSISISICSQKAVECDISRWCSCIFRSMWIKAMQHTTDNSKPDTEHTISIFLAFVCFSCLTCGFMFFMVDYRRFSLKLRNKMTSVSENVKERARNLRQEVVGLRMELQAWQKCSKIKYRLYHGIWAVLSQVANMVQNFGRIRTQTGQQ